MSEGAPSRPIRQPTSADRPPGFPYTLIDQIEQVDLGVSATGWKLVARNDPYFVGHFPGAPVFPGVLVCEALAQLAAIAVDDPALRLLDVARARFRRPVTPGDVVHLKVEVAPPPSPRRVRGVARTGDVIVAEVELLCAPPTGPRIHPMANVSPYAELDAGVTVGPGAVIGPEVRIGRDSTIGANAIVVGRSTLGARVQIFPLASIGCEPQDRKYRGEPSRVEIGDETVFREFSSINSGTTGGGMVTRVGQGCLFMNGAHVAHDCIVGDHVILANSAALAGHCTVGDYAIVGGLAGVHQFVRVGESALCAAGAMVSMDAPPYCMVAGDRARLHGVNVIGLERRGFAAETVAAIKRAYGRLFRGAGRRADVVDDVRRAFETVPEVGRLCDFVSESPRGVCR